MKELQFIFEIVRKHCLHTGVSNVQCFHELERREVNNSIYFPMSSYLLVLQSLGLIRLSKFRKVIVITEKGKTAPDGVMSASRVHFVFFLHRLRRLVIVAVLFAFFWPMFLFVQKHEQVLPK